MYIRFGYFINRERNLINRVIIQKSCITINSYFYFILFDNEKLQLKTDKNSKTSK